MKTFSILTFLAALAAFLFAPLSLEASGSLLFGAGLFAILLGDYSAHRPAGRMLALAPATTIKASVFRLAA